MHRLFQKASEMTGVRWKQTRNEHPLRYDLLAEGCLLVEMNATETVHPIHKPQLLSYMKIAGHAARLDHQL